VAITLGSEFVFASGSTEVPVVRALSDDKFVVAWRDAADSDKGKICVGTRSGTDITYGPTLTFTPGVLNAGAHYDYARQTHDVAVLDEDSIFVAYVLTDFYSYGLVCTVSGDVLTSGATYHHSAGLANKTKSVACAAFTNDKVMWTLDYENTWNGQYLRSKIASITGTTISLGVESAINESYVDHPRVTIIDEDRALMTWSRQRLWATKYLRGAIYTRSGTVLTRGASKNIYTAPAAAWEPRENEPVLLSSGTVAKLAIAHNWADDLRATYISTSGASRVIAVEDNALLTTNSIYLGASVAKDEDEFDILYVDRSDSSYGKIARGKITGDTQAYSDAEIWHEASSADHHATLLTYPFAVVAYRDTANSNYGTARIIQLPVDAQIGLYIQGPIPFSGTSPLYIANIGEISASGDLFIEGLSSTPWSASGDLFVNGLKTTQASSDMFVGGYDNHLGSGDLFIKGLTDIGASGDLYTNGATGATTGSCDLFTRGTVAASGGAAASGQAFDWLEKTPDYDPQFVGSFDTAATLVTVQVWDITNGVNTALALASSGCYQIGDTNYWGWSTEHLPTHYSGHLYYQMNSDAGEIFWGQAMFVTEDQRWKHPDDRSTYIR